MAEVYLKEQLRDMQRRKFVEEDYDYFSASFNGSNCMTYMKFVKEGNQTELFLGYDGNNNNISGSRVRTPPIP